jgi:branched-chain amino acid aminotransferase
MGATATDLCRTVKHKLYRWDEHLGRFRRSCDAARIPLLTSHDELTRIADELVNHNSAWLSAEQDLALVLFATPGSIGFYGGGEGGVGDGAGTLGMHTFPLPFARYRRIFREGAQLALAQTRQVSASAIDPRIKQRSRLHWWLADREIQESHPGAFAVLVDDIGNLTETAAANLLVVQKGVVLSPPRGTILEGISLGTVRELCADLNIAFEERFITPSDAETAEEIMLSSTPYCLCGVSRFNSRSMTWPGKVFQRLLAGWSQLIDLDIRNQIETVD